MALYEILVKFFATLVSKFPINPLTVLSAPSAAFKIWRTVQLPKLNSNNLKVYDLSRRMDAKLREGYCGGIVDVYKPRLIGKGSYSEELRFALKNGYQLLQVGAAYSFSRGANTFLELIQQLNSMKIEAQENSQPTIRNIAKLLMNSMYGRFGMQTDPLKTAIIDPDQLNEWAKRYTILGEIPLGSQLLISYTLQKSNLNLGTPQWDQIFQRFEESLAGNTNVAIAAAVTAYSRIIINELKLEAINAGLNIYYSDTDSLVVDGQMPDSFVDKTALGMLKLEHKFKEGIFVMPKVYYLELEDGSIVGKVKGFSGKLNRSQYLELLQGDSLELSVTKWSRSLRQSQVQITRNTAYSLKFMFNKRQQVFRNGKWVDTKPLILGQGGG